MRIKGVKASSIRNEATVILERENLEPIELTVRALSPLHPDEAEQDIPSPRPDLIGPLRGKKNKIEFHPDTGKPILLYDEEDPEYKAKLSRTRNLRATKMVVDALDPDQMGFDTQRNGKTPEQYYDAIRKEMAEYGFSLGDLNKIGEAVAEVSGISLEDMEEARAGFTEMED